MSRLLNHSALGRPTPMSRLRRRLSGAGLWLTLPALIVAVWGLLKLAAWFPGGYARHLPTDPDWLFTVLPPGLALLAIAIGLTPPTRPVVRQGGVEWRRGWTWPIGVACWALALAAAQAGNLSRLPEILAAGDAPRLAVAAGFLLLILGLVVRGLWGGLRRPVILAIDHQGLSAPRDGLDRLTWGAVEAVIADPEGAPAVVRLALEPGWDRSGLRRGWPDIDEIELTLSGAGTDAAGFLAALRAVAPAVEIRAPRPPPAAPQVRTLH